jgi:hypothetical protein
VQPNQGAAECQPCASGRFTDVAGARQCKACPSGQYQDGTAGLAGCKNCISGKYSVQTGGNSPYSCLFCSAGFFSDTLPVYAHSELAVNASYTSDLARFGATVDPTAVAIWNVPNAGRDYKAPTYVYLFFHATLAVNQITNVTVSFAADDIGFLSVDGVPLAAPSFYDEIGTATTQLLGLEDFFLISDPFVSYTPERVASLAPLQRGRTSLRYLRTIRTGLRGSS